MAAHRCVPRCQLDGTARERLPRPLASADEWDARMRFTGGDVPSPGSHVTFLPGSCGPAPHAGVVTLRFEPDASRGARGARGARPISRDARRGRSRRVITRRPGPAPSEL
jgi:hypothetical protein